MASSNLLTDKRGLVSTSIVLFSSVCECVLERERSVLYSKIYVGNVLC